MRCQIVAEYRVRGSCHCCAGARLASGGDKGQVLLWSRASGERFDANTADSCKWKALPLAYALYMPGIKIAAFDFPVWLSAIISTVMLLRKAAA